MVPPIKHEKRQKHCAVFLMPPQVGTIAATKLNIPSMSLVSFNNLPNSSTNVLAIKQQQPPLVVDLDALQAASRVL